VDIQTNKAYLTHAANSFACGSAPQGVLIRSVTRDTANKGWSLRWY
jgi:hypothetical protein